VQGNSLVRSMAPAAVAAMLLAVLAVPALAATGGALGSATSSGPVTAAAAAPAPPLLVGPAMSQATPVITCGPGLLVGSYTAYYSDPAKTMFLCEKSCGDTDCTKFTPYFTISQTCCPRID
jgi:hypothetical protein